MDKAIVLLSGGIDSATVAFIAKEKGYKIYAISFDYGQKNRFEIKAAKNIADMIDAEKHMVLEIGLSKLGGSALTDDITVPENEDIREEQIPVTYVPARNTIFLSYAIAWAEVLDLNDIFFGANIVDYSGYPDCRSEYIEAFEKMSNLGTKKGDMGDCFKIHAPLQKLSKTEIIKKGYNLGVDYSKTSSCYNPNDKGIACGRCDSCVIRKDGFREANISDPIKYKYEG